MPELPGAKIPTQRVDEIQSSQVGIKDDSILKQPLAGLVGFDPKAFICGDKFDECDSFILSLGLVYNDFKAVNCFHSLLREYPSISTAVPDKHLGQLSGMENWIFRCQVGILEELTVLLKEKESVVQSKELELASGTMGQGQLRFWNQVLELANIKKSKDPWVSRLKAFLTKVRANGGYHYYQNKKLKAGYLAAYSGPLTPYNRLCYMSLGMSMEQSRFYFADAAIVQQTSEFSSDLASSFDEFHKEFEEYLRALHISIRFLIERYVQIRGLTMEIVEP